MVRVIVQLDVPVVDVGDVELRSDSASDSDVYSGSVARESSPKPGEAFCGPQVHFR